MPDLLILTRTGQLAGVFPRESPRGELERMPCFCVLRVPESWANLRGARYVDLDGLPTSAKRSIARTDVAEVSDVEFVSSPFAPVDLAPERAEEFTLFHEWRRKEWGRRGMESEIADERRKESEGSPEDRQAARAKRLALEAKNNAKIEEYKREAPLLRVALEASRTQRVIRANS